MKIPTPQDLETKATINDMTDIENTVNRINHELSAQFPEKKVVTVEIRRVRQRISHHVIGLFKESGWIVTFEDTQNTMCVSSNDPREYDDGKRTTFTVRATK